jgi:hypothetical protein
MGWCSVGVNVGIKSWHDRLASRTDSKHNPERRSLDRHQTPVEDNTPLDDLACNTRKEIEVFEGSRFRRALCLCAMAPALVGRAKRGGCLRRVQHEFCVFYSCLLCALSSSDLALHLLASPFCSIDGSRLELSVRPRLFDHCHQPFGTIVLREFAVGKGFRKVT